MEAILHSEGVTNKQTERKWKRRIAWDYRTGARIDDVLFGGS